MKYEPLPQEKATQKKLHHKKHVTAFQRGLLLLIAFFITACCTVTISSQPKSQTVAVGQKATFSVTASSSVTQAEILQYGGTPDDGHLSYAWYRNGMCIQGANQSSYSLIAAATDNGAQFYVVVSDGVSSLKSSVATLTVSGSTTPPPPPPQNLLGILAGNFGGAGNINGNGSSSRFDEPWGMAVDSSGNIYVTDSANNTIRKISPSGAVTLLAGDASIAGTIIASYPTGADGNGTSAHFFDPTGLAIDSSGNLYVTDSFNDTIRMVSPSGTVTTLAGFSGLAGSSDGSGSNASFNTPQGIAIDKNGNLYVADTGNDTIRLVTPAGVVTTLAGQAGVAGSSDGAAASATFNSPAGIAVDGSGNIYVADTGNNTIRKINGGQVTTLAGYPGAQGTSDGSGNNAFFYQPVGLVVDGSGNLYVGDGHNQTIRKVTSAGVVTTLAGSGGVPGSSDGTGSAARFTRPLGLALDSSGNLYVADGYYPGNNNYYLGVGNNTIRKVTTAGVVTTLAGAAALTGSANGSGSAATFYNPTGVIADSNGNLYVTDSANNTVRKVTPSGAVTTLAGTAGVTGSSDGTGAAASFSEPTGIGIDSSDNLYVADTGNNTIRKITTAGVVTTFAGTAGVRGSANGTGGSASFFNPAGVTVDSSGNVYVADSANNTIRKITSAGVVTTLAGTPGDVGAADGTGAAATFNLPRSLAVDSSGNLYVADTLNNTLRLVTPAGVVTTLAGTAGVGGGADGTGSAASFYYPEGITLGSDGYLYVADTFNGSVRKVSTAGVVSTVVGISGEQGVITGSLPASLSFPLDLVMTSNGLFITSVNGVLAVTF